MYFFSSDYRNAEADPPVYMELEKETPLQEDTAGDAALNPIYDRFVCLFSVNFELFLFYDNYSYSRVLLLLIAIFNKRTDT